MFGLLLGAVIAALNPAADGLAGGGSGGTAAAAPLPTSTVARLPAPIAPAPASRPAVLATAPTPSLNAHVGATPTQVTTNAGSSVNARVMPTPTPVPPTAASSAFNARVMPTPTPAPATIKGPAPLITATVATGTAPVGNGGSAAVTATRGSGSLPAAGAATGRPPAVLTTTPLTAPAGTAPLRPTGTPLRAMAVPLTPTPSGQAGPFSRPPAPLLAAWTPGPVASPGITLTSTLTATPTTTIGVATPVKRPAFVLTATIGVTLSVTVDHYRLGKDRPTRAMEWYGPLDAPVTSLPRFEPFRLRFQISNRLSQAVRLKPRLEWSAQPNSDFRIVRVTNAAVPFYVGKSGVISNGEAIDVSSLALGPGIGRPQPGKAYDEVSEAPELVLEPGSYTELEFSVRASADAHWQTAYYFRLTDGGIVLPGSTVAQLTMGTAPMPSLTQPQYQGRPASSSQPSPGRTAASRSADAPLAGPNPHLNYSPTTDQCALCHQTHTGQAAMGLIRGGSQSDLCFTCHNGSGATSNVASQFSDGKVPANDATSSSFYSHPATVLGSGPTGSGAEVFRGVLNRRSECTDCHSPHQADATAPPVMTARGWTVSGAGRGVSGVAVTNGAAGSAPTYTALTASTYEYETCSKCHSSYTVLLAQPNYATHPSYQLLDTGREFNPANASTHPVEAAGRNLTAALAAQLALPSTYKLWNFTTGDQLRCVNCHGNYRLADPAAPPAANARLSPHTSQYRGLLMNSYQDRQLLPLSATNNYAAANFALCYQCHGEAPFVDRSGDARTDTNFPFHGFHLNAISSNPAGGTGGTDIDVAGAGQGNALCAECHFRTHSSASAVDATQQSYARLLNFAPNVTGPASGLAPIWDASNRTCALTCHGKVHNPEGY